MGIIIYRTYKGFWKLFIKKYRNNIVLKNIGTDCFFKSYMCCVVHNLGSDRSNMT